MTNRGGWWTAEQIREMCANAWDEGFVDGHLNAQAVKNPYRE